ncbi:MAG: ATP-binding cassette domain-containing protein [Bacilli bacterium]
MLEVKGLTKKYGRRTALRDVSITFKRGEITCLLGINGVGKSTLLKCITGLYPLSSGRVTLDNEPIDHRNLKRVAFVPDTSTLPLSNTIDACLDYMATFYPNWNQTKAEQLLTFFQLNRTDNLKSLSKGTLAKVNLLIGLAQQSDYILLDEPFSGIDVFSREQIIQFLASDYLDANQGVILTTHEIGEIEHFADRVLLLKDNRIAADFYPETIREQTGKNIVDYMREVYFG